MTPADIARACHEANRALCISQGDHSQASWDDAEPWQRDSAVAGVLHAQANPDATPSEMHEAWSADKRRAGWVYGPAKDPRFKTHPCLVPFADLPPGQRAKDSLFLAVVRALSPEGATEAARDAGAHAVDPDPIGRMFGLSYSAYQVLPRVLLQSMPRAWQRRFADLLEEVPRQFPNFECGPYEVRMEDGSEDPLLRYRRRKLTP